jgi:5,10-methylene-tetrahydrofolate dehydrogenase/methenyl tetrahydrofolate cyclohydrolase
MTRFELSIVRVYDKLGTNGTLSANGQFVCFTIELPWLNNQRKLSCIPEGRYKLVKRYTAKRGNHILVVGVPGRSLILFHPANDALKELEGCIAPVTKLTGPGKGASSRPACSKVLAMVYAMLDQGGEVYVTFTSQPAI